MPIRALDLFCGGGGSSWGARAAGAEVVCGVDASAYADEPEVEVRYDADGLRNPPDLAAWDVAVVGVSFIEAGTVADADTPTAVLASRLGLVVKNVGVSHTGPRSHVRLLRELGNDIVFFEGLPEFFPLVSDTVHGNPRYEHHELRVEG